MFLHALSAPIDPRVYPFVGGARESEETEIWMRASYSRLLRKLGKVLEAQAQEDVVR